MSHDSIGTERAFRVSLFPITISRTFRAGDIFQSSMLGRTVAPPQYAAARAQQPAAGGDR
jgi:hypothetical protein